MGEDRIEMSQRERDVLKVMSAVLKGERSAVEAARLLRRSVRHVRRIRRRLERAGDGGLVHRMRGRPSNRRLNPVFRVKVLAAYRKDYSGFGPTLASEKLAERKLAIGVETLRRWLLAEGLWQRQRRRDVHRARRERRACLGELVQMDTSIHDWLEGRGASMVLTAMIDDATGKIAARFYAGETTEGHMDLLGRYLRRRGRPVALYTDRDSIYRVEGRLDPDRPLQTQFARALSQLDIELILARSPQAKGRVERLFGTLQDRWVKELRLARVRTMKQANALLDRTLIPRFNRRFAVKPASPNDAHRPLQPAHDLEAILCPHTRRVVANDYTVRFENRLYQLHPPVWPGLRGGQVTLQQRADGLLKIRFKERYLPFRDLGEVVSRRSGEVGPPLALNQVAGAPPPHPRSLSLGRHPAGSHAPSIDPPAPAPASASPPKREEGCVSRSKTQPPAVRTTARRSGRTPALPYPPDGTHASTATSPPTPHPAHPWRRSYKH